MTFDKRLISNVQVDGIDTRDYPDFCDAYIVSADYDGQPMTNEQIEELNQDYEYVSKCVWDSIF